MASKDVFHPAISPDQARRLFARVRLDPETGCWLWVGPTNPSGHGVASTGDQSTGTHRIFFFLCRGPIPADTCLCHQCHRPACVNPMHLEIGDDAINGQDRAEHRQGKVHTLISMPFPEDPGLLPWVTQSRRSRKASGAPSSGRRAAVAGELSAAERAAVVEVARIVGSLAERGPSAGQPSITALLRDIAAGVVTCRRRQGGRAARSTLADRIAELRAREPGLSAPQVATRLGCGESTVRAVWAKLRAETQRSNAGSSAA